MSLNEVNPTSDHWQQELLESVTSLEELSKLGLLTFKNLDALSKVSDSYRIRIPKYYLNLINREDLANCPIRKQSIPSIDELDPLLPEWLHEISLKYLNQKTPWLTDAIGDVSFSSAARITHRYENRAILHVSSLCAMYCRFCFRKSHLNEKEKQLYEGSLTPALNYLKLHNEIEEVILTGGDPLSLNDIALEKLLNEISQIKHIKILRIHTRMPVTLPSRMSENLLNILNNFNSKEFKIYLVAHFNHPVELTPISLEKLYKFSRAGISVLNQSVLMRNVNDNVNDLKTLFQTLYRNGIFSFHLHHPDWTKGTFHFRLPLHRGVELVKELEGSLSGPSKPEYVLDLPQGFGKISIQNQNLNSVFSHNDKTFSANVYEYTKSKTRSGTNQKVFYLDAAYSK